MVVAVAAAEATTAAAMSMTNNKPFLTVYSNLA